ncbi:hypothetical protein C8F01DRAFT_1087252 [Mycena amicta]|nr:hypothetical protein C8F01DRAFT_1087252 [Mycena amicta]
MHPLKLLPTTLLLFASVAVATHSESSHGRQHGELAQRLSESESALEKRATYNNVPMTWYPNNTGPDACTGKNHKDSDWYVALYSPQFGDGSACCGKKMRITANGKTTVATCVDSCPTCTAWGALDMTKDLYQFFGNGDYTASWSYASDDDSDDGDDSPPPPPKKTTTTTHHSSTHTTTHTTTSTTHSTTTTHSSSSTHSTSHSASATHSSASPSPSPSGAPAGPDSEVIKSFSDSMLGLAALVLQAPGAQ